jgi:hypothetical protein
MNRIAVFALIAGAALSMGQSASAQQIVRPQWNAYGSPVCPSNYEYQDGLCISIYGHGYREHGYREHYRDRRGGGDSVPAQWNAAAGTVVCPRNYEYVVRVNRCVSVY